MFVRIYFASALMVCVFARELPDYLKPCKLSDPKFEECAIANGNAAIRTLVKGDATFNVPDMSPLVIPEVNIETGGNLKIKFSDVRTDSLSTVKLIKFNLNEKSKVLSAAVTVDSLIILTNYEINGQILILPITGNGRCNITYADGTYDFKMTYKVVEKHGRQYLEVVDSTVDFSPKRGYFHFDNLFNGDKRLGDEMNKFIDDNWSDFSGEIKPAVSKTMASVISNVFTAYFRKVPKDSIFLP